MTAEADDRSLVAEPSKDRIWPVETASYATSILSLPKRGDRNETFWVSQ
jgi:hypothetical protein